MTPWKSSVLYFDTEGRLERRDLIGWSSNRRDAEDLIIAQATDHARAHTHEVRLISPLGFTSVITCRSCPIRFVATEDM